ncbi:MAG: glycosyltransferase family 2 protein [Bradymonadia bacterium]
MSLLWVPLALGVLWGFGAFVVASVAITRRWAMARRPASQPIVDPQTPMVLLRPCAGSEIWLSHTLASAGAAEVSGPLIYRVTVADPEDAARPIAEQVCADLRGQGMDAQVWVVDVGEAPNHKAAQIAQAIARLDAPCWVLSADSDVDLTGVDLEGLRRLAGDGVAWMPPAERGPVNSWGDRASQAWLGASLHAFPLLSAIDPQGLVGKLFALSPAAVQALEGFAPLVDYLGEDMELSRRVQAAGLSVSPSTEVVPAVTHGRTLKGIIGRYSRWLTVIRAQRPALLITYPLFFFPLWPVTVLLALGASAAPSVALTAWSVLALNRLAVAAAARRFARRPLQPWCWPMDVALSELALTASFLKALRSRSVVWRGRRLRIDPSGRLWPDPSTSGAP